MLVEYREHVNKRKSQNIPPKPLNADQTSGLVKLLKNPPKLDKLQSRPSQNKKRRSRKLSLKDKEEDGSNKLKNIDFKGKRKSDRWKKIEKRSKLKSVSIRGNGDQKKNKRSKKNKFTNKLS